MISAEDQAYLVAADLEPVKLFLANALQSKRKVHI